MNLHPDVLTDLTILYHAGEASQASRALLEEAAKSDARLAAALAAPPRMASLPAGAPDVQRRAIDQLEGKTRKRGTFLGLGLLFLLLPFSFAVIKGELKFLLMRDAPVVAFVSFGVGLGLVGTSLRMYRLR
jgi:hypothetical protein